jgi:transcriptional regulator with XRE-family HTH domain
MVDELTLGAFLRGRREQLRPGDVGLPDNGRRRTPGLRREEVAALAGVSIDYLVRLEQGKDTRPSGQVLAALADALQLDDDARIHVKKLATITGSPELCPSHAPTQVPVAATVQAVLDRFGPVPAFVVGPWGDLLAGNETWHALAGPLGYFDHQPPNLARHAFLHPAAPAVYTDWSQVADEQVARLRAGSMHWGFDPGYIALVDDLRGLPEFDRRWSTHAVSEKHRGTKRVVHPDVGELRVDFEVLLLPDDGEQRVIAWLPADEATSSAIERAVRREVPSSPATLRVVGEG